MSDEQEIMELTLELLPEPEKRPMGDFLQWIGSAFSLYFQKIGIWLVMGLITTAILFGLSLVAPKKSIELSWIFNLVNFAVQTMLAGGFILSAASWAEERELNISYMFSAFQYKWKELCQFVAWYLVFAILLTIIVLVIVFYSLTMNKFFGFKWIYFMPIIYLPISMALWLAPSLIVLHDIAPLKAIKMSFLGCVKNITPFILVMIASLVSIYSILNMTGLFIWLTKWFNVLIIILLSPSYSFLFLLFGITFISANIMIFMSLLMYTSYRNIWTNLPMR